MISSRRQLAVAIGRDEKSIRKWLADDRWPFSRTGPWDQSLLPKILAWATSTLAPNPAAEAPTPHSTELTPERQLKVAIGFEKLQALKSANEARRGEVHSVAECHRQQLRRITETRDRFILLPDTLPCDNDLKEIIRARIIELLRWLAGDLPIPAWANPELRKPATVKRRRRRKGK
ncbi:MAG TPA: hypothetical protein VH370_07985 [Humisphaera sp.]|jgi:hypothetical protein|nr:hypothetical protein [Humisphaera sp.]